MMFNINDNIKARVTKRGHDIHKAQYKNMMKSDNGYLLKKYPYAPIHENSDGWSTWQMWVFMAAFGPYMGNCCDMPAATEIEILE